MKNIFLTGKKSVGKSTLIRQVLDHLNLSAGGYVTEREVVGNIRRFTVRSLYDSTESYPIANVNINDYSKEVFKDSFNIGLVSILEKSLKNREIIVLDELGFFENDSQEFKSKIHDLLDSKTIVLGTIKEYDCDFLNSIRSRSDVLVIELTRQKYDQVFNTLITTINGHKLK